MFIGTKFTFWCFPNGLIEQEEKREQSREKENGETYLDVTKVYYSGWEALEVVGYTPRRVHLDYR